MVDKVIIRASTENDWKVIQEMNYQVFENDQENDDDLDMTYPFSDEGVNYYHKLASGEYGKCFYCFYKGYGDRLYCFGY